MKAKIFFLSLTLGFVLNAISQNFIFIAKTCEISFFSDGILEDICAINTFSNFILNTATHEIAVKVTIKNFDFKKKLMKEHFNEKYMESDKYPYATFQGKINGMIGYEKEGTYKVTATGKLNIHGVEKERIIEGTVTIKGEEIILNAKFMVALKEHNITIPFIVIQNIAKIVEVKLKAILSGTG